jgi:MtrB/PioB family decaheme-associated outer membrane protein
MTSNHKRFVERTLVISVRSALTALAFVPAAFAADSSDAVRDLTQPVSQIEVGVGYVDDGSAKFGEYNGLDKKGAYGIGNFQVFGGGGEESAYRWRIFGTDLGLDSRNIQGEAGTQGKFRVTFGYDELVRNYSNSYQTLWRGSGTSTMTLPSGYPASNPAAVTAGNGPLYNWNNIQAPYANAACANTGGVPTAACRGPGYLIPADMTNFDLGTKRHRSDLGANVDLGSGWSFGVTARHEEKEGNKLTGVAMGGFKGALMPEPISSTTDIFGAKFSYNSKNANLVLGYNASFYKNDIKAWTVQYPFAATSATVPGVLNNLSMMNGAPDNQMQQFNLLGTYNFSPATRLLLNGSYSRLTQNQDFVYQSGPGWIVPATSADAKVIMSNFVAKLTTRQTKDLFLTLGYKYNDHDDQSPSRTYRITQYDSPLPAAAPTSAALNANNNLTNEPTNRKQHQFNLDADYKLGRGQSLWGGYEWQQIERTTDGDENVFRAEKSTENTGRIEYRNLLSEGMSGRLSYAYSQRRVSEYREPEINPAGWANNVGGLSELPGFRQFFIADRNRDKLRGALSVQASDALSLQAGIDYNSDKYPSQYGLKETSGWVLNLDSTYAASENVSFNVFYTYEDMKAKQESLSMAVNRNTTPVTINATPALGSCAAYTAPAGTLPNGYYTDPCRMWSESQGDKVNTLGIGFKSGGMMGGKLVISGDLAYSRTKTPISFTGGVFSSNGAAVNPNVWFPAQSFPNDATSEMTDLRLVALYTIDKSSALRLNYRYGRLSSTDWAYDAYANSSLGVTAVQAFIGPAMTSPNYTVNVLGLTYIYRFR